ncbi:MAG: hypothetical protein M1376_12380 [Planctomycetes bacterium]|nr:hypothetical protein [Planctomycetota bacterium]
MKTHVVARAMIVGTVALLICAVYPNQTARAQKEEPTGTNNLSYPVIWADGTPLVSFVTESWTGSYWIEYQWTAEDDTPMILLWPGDEDPPADVPEDATQIKWYVQQDPGNTWQADTVIGSGETFTVAEIDWGDNLESNDWTTRSTVRVETVLFNDDVPDMTAYTMKLLEGLGTDEMWGADKTSYEVYEASKKPIVYSDEAWLTIQKVPEESTLTTWSQDDHAWQTEDPQIPAEPVVWEKASAEINIQGKVVYGYNWMRTEHAIPGIYRITFSFTYPPAARTVVIDSATTITALSPEAVTIAAEGGGGTAYIDIANNLTYIDVNIVAGGGSGGGGGDGGGGGGPKKGPR